ncbi:MAG: acyl-CoA dehydrogenase family protein [Planctomycetota bacterium]
MTFLEPTSELFLEDEHLALRDAVRSWIDGPGKEFVTAEDHRPETARAIVASLGQEGLLAPLVAEDGSTDVEVRSVCVLREALAFASSLVDTQLVMQGLGSFALALGGTEAQRSAWLPKVALGEAVAAFALTEPEAGTDVAGLTTKARREGDQWILSGEKTLISNAGIADFYLLFARTSDGEKRHNGISLFLLPKDTGGLEIRPLELIAPHPIGELHLKECTLPADALIGEEGRAFGLAMASLDLFRPTVGAAACGIAARALHESIAHVQKRRQFGQPLSGFQSVQAMIATMATELEASRLLVYRAAAVKDQGQERITREGSMAKMYATEAASRIVDSAVQLRGGRGVVKGEVVERLYREVRALRIYEGTTEVQRLIIAGRVFEESGI